MCPVFIFERCNRLLLKVIADIAKSGILAQPRLWRRRLARRWRGRYAAHGERVAEAKKLQICTIRPIARGRKKERFVKAVEQRVYKNCGIALAVAFGTCLLAINGFRFGLRSGHRCPRENVRSLPFRKRDVSNGTDHREKKLSFGHLKSPTPYVKAAISLNNLVARESCIYPLPSTIYSALVAFLVCV